VNLDDPDARPRWYTNAIEVPVDGDVYPADNTWEDVAVKGELDRVELWMEPFGHSNMWGEAQPGATVTVTTPVSQVTTIVGHPECERCWGIGDVGPIEPGDTVIVESGAGLLPVVVDVPDPFTAAASSETDVVSGQIGGWLNERLQIHGHWPDGYKEVLTDGSGNFLGVYDDVPPGADGYVRFETEANYARVVFHRPFRTMDLVMEVNYDHEWAQGSYEPGHTIWLTVTDQFGAVRDTAQVVSAPIPDWGGESGFSVNMQIEPLDWVSGRVDNGFTGALHVGTIAGHLSTRNDSIHGTVGANWIAQQVRVECHTWGAPAPAPNKEDMVTPNGADPYACSWDPDTEWDIQLFEDVAVSYDDPDGHRVFAVFFKSDEIFLPLILKKQ
ncbi:MAG TPA: hypothetical protein VLY63_12965, partial [Anaerolineae bacterium]|nr:hypothetical protein [Anaerolineae bacterium]